MEHINPGLPEPYQVQWHNIVGKTPWLTARDHLSEDELRHFYQESGPEISAEPELATDDMYHWAVEDAAQRESGNQPIPPSHADKAQTGTLQDYSFQHTKTCRACNPNNPLP